MPDSTTPSHAAIQLAERLAQPKPMRRGSLSERFVKCSKPGCPCASDPKARHGPYFSLTRAVQGRTQSRLVSLRTVGRRGSGRRIYRHCGGGQKRGLQASFQAEVRQEIEHLIGASSTREIDFEAWETAARSCALRLAARALEAHLNADRSDYSGARRDCPCG
ncbi:MAG: DUF6788 family protein, partial [Bryobacteraceae bacterium]